MSNPIAKLETLESSPQKLSLKISGHLDSYTIGDIWQQSVGAIQEVLPKVLTIDAASIEYCDGSGIGLFIELNTRLLKAGGKCEIKNLKDEFQKLLDAYEPQKPFEITSQEKAYIHPIASLGITFVEFLKNIKEQITFMGEMVYTLLHALRQPKNIRWADVWYVLQTHGANALSIVCLINFLMGLILAFQAAVMLRLFGAEAFVANGVGLGTVRVIGPLMTAIVLAGRTGSSFAAEIGTMKVNEEIDAIYTMGLNPMRFLTVSRVLGVLLLMPILTLFAEVAGILGGVTVMAPMGQSVVDYFSRVFESVRLNDFFIGLVKSLVFGVAIASVGCLKGFKTKTGASAVGVSATEAVVNSLVLLILIEGIFSVVCYFLGI